jgi:hypothetical protein
VEKMPPRIFTMVEAAAELRVSRRWLQDFLPTIPSRHLQAGRKKLFDEEAMETIREAMRVKPDPIISRRSRRFVPSEYRISGSSAEGDSTTLRARLAERKRNGRRNIAKT